MFNAWLNAVLAWLALPEFGLTTVFLVSFVSATLVPLGSEPAVFGMIKLRPDLFWEIIGVATLGNVLGGLVNYWMGYVAVRAYEKARERMQETGQETAQEPKAPPRVFDWLKRFGPKACVLAWMPIFGDPLCAVAGWLKLPFWPCAAWMSVGKFLRYLTMTSALLWMF